MKKITCCFTGHRDIPLLQRPVLKHRLTEVVRRLAENGVTRFCTGGALGFDTLAAQAVLKVKKQLPQVQLQLILPCRDQTRHWQREDIALYEDILEQADGVTYTAEAYFRGCMQLRNRHLVDSSGTCVAFCRMQSGGTAYTLAYAKQQGLDIINL